jgi:hypothetical protein
MAEQPEPRAVPLVWVGLDELAILFANQALIQHVVRDEFVLSFGQVTPPVLLGSQEAQEQQLGSVGFVPVKPIARVSFNRQRLQELISVLQENLVNHDNTFGVDERE